MVNKTIDRKQNILKGAMGRVLERAVGSTRSARSGSDRMDRIEGFY